LSCENELVDLDVLDPGVSPDGLKLRIGQIRGEALNRVLVGEALRGSDLPGQRRAQPARVDRPLLKDHDVPLLLRGRDLLLGPTGDWRQRSARVSTPPCQPGYARHP
jgi:hypothetical protein